MRLHFNSISGAEGVWRDCSKMSCKESSRSSQAKVCGKVFERLSNIPRVSDYITVTESIKQ